MRTYDLSPFWRSTIGFDRLLELPDDTPIERVLFSTKIQNALRAADLRTVGEVREISDETLISLPDFGRGSLSDLRKKLGLPSTDGVRPLGNKPA